MRVLHLLSNAKWTGPAEPALNLCVALRRGGVDADFACAPDAGRSINKVVETARDRGIEPILRFNLSKHAHPIKDLWDRIALTRFLKTSHYDIVHCHLDNDHRIALGPASKLGIPVVRSNYEGTGFKAKAPCAKLLEGTAYLIEPSTIALEHDTAAFGYPSDRMRVIPGAVDTDRFNPAREVPDARRWLGIPPGAFVVGIVARMQKHRRFEDLWEAIGMLIEAHRNAHVIVVGRGTNQAAVGQQPVKRLGLEGHVHFPGFVDGENYVGMLKAFDVKVLLVPGSDGTCRAVREAMAMARPAVVADRGMLREIVDHGENGLVCDGSPRSLFDALRQLAASRQRTRALGRAAREKAATTFSLETQAAAVCGVYESIPAPCQP